MFGDDSTFETHLSHGVCEQTTDQEIKKQTNKQTKNTNKFKKPRL